MKNIDKAEQTMIENLEKNYGKSLNEWINIVIVSGLKKHGEIVKYLKSEHEFTHGYAGLVAHKVLRSDAASGGGDDKLINEQYKNKAELKKIYDIIIKEISQFGPELEISPKKAYVSLRVKRQFALIQPSTKSRLDIGINLKGTETTERLESSGSWNIMCSHRVRLTNESEVDSELIGWLRSAFEKVK